MPICTTRACIDARASERRRGARVGVRLRRMRARVRPRWAASASGCSRRSERTGVPITRNAGACLGHARRLSTASARSPPRPPIVARRARAARARGARQVHLRHEGEGAPRVARPVQALGGTVRPAPAAAAVRVCGGAGAAPLRVALPRRGAGAEPRGVGCGGGGVSARRPSAEPTHAWLARAADRRAVRGGPEPPGAAARWARRSAYNTELAALPAAADWPKLREL
jgi:hypothetical protein